MKIFYFYEMLVNSRPYGVFCTNWKNSFTIISGNLLHRIDRKKEKQNDFKHVVAAMLLLS